MKKLLFALAISGCAVDSTEPPSTDDSNFLPDGTVGVERVIMHGQEQDVPWVAKHGLKYVSDDYAIGEALVKQAELASPVSVVWPKAIMPYCIHEKSGSEPLGLTAAEQTLVDNALAIIANQSPVTFERHNCSAIISELAAEGLGDAYVDYIHWAVSDGNETVPPIGHAHGATIHVVTPNSGAFGPGNITHETGHALGFMHEQMRTDRGNYVNFTKSCVHGNQGAPLAEALAQFDVVTSNELTPYDVHSIMEYNSWNFATFAADGTTLLCPPLLFGGADPAHAPIWGTYTPPGGSTITLRGTLISPDVWSAEDSNGTYTWYEQPIGSPETNDMLGTSMVSGDFDGDGYDDLAVGAIGEQVGSHHGGAVFLYKGTMNGLVVWKILDENKFSSVTTHSNDDFGMSLAAGDLDGDGITDLAVGAPLYGSTQGGAVFVFKGAVGGPVPLGKPITEATLGAGNVELGDFFGNALAIGKLAGGTRNYLAIGAPFENAGTPQPRGMVSVTSWSGSAFTLFDNLHPSDLDIAVDNGMFGYALAAGDMNRDGVDDLAVGAPANGVGHGNVGVFYGHSTAMVPGKHLTIEPGNLATDDRFGTALAYNSGDLLVGAPGRGGSGRAYKYEAFSVSTGYELLEQMEYMESMVPGQSGQTGDSFGASVAIADVDGDYYVDAIIGAPHKTVSGFAGAGNVTISSYQGNKVIAPQTPGTNERFGQSLAVGNFDRGAKSVVSNGQLDLALGIPGRMVSGNTNAGAFNSYKGTSQALWRSMTESTHQGP